MNLRARLHAQHHVMRMRVFAAQVVRIIGYQHGNIQFLFHTEKVRMNSLLIGQALILNLKIEIAAPKDVLILLRHTTRLLVVTGHELFADLATQATGKSDQPLRVLGQKLLADARLSVEAMQRGLRGNSDQILVALFVFSQHQQVVVLVVLRLGPVILVLADIELAAQNRLDTLLLGCIKKMHRSEDVAVIGHCHRALPQFGSSLDKLFHVAGAVKQRVFGMQVQMGKFSHDQLQFY